MKKNIPTFEFTIDDTQETGVKAISIVTDPAFKSPVVYFEKDKPKYITLADKKKQIVAGLSLIPNVKIYRYDKEEDLEYYGYFTPDTVERIVDKYHQEMLSNKVNVDHNDNAFIDAYMVEDYIVNSEQRVQDLQKKGIVHKNIMGAWYTAFKIKDPAIFSAIENSGDATGFSPEAFLNKFMAKMNEEVKNKIITSKVQQEMKKVNKTIKEKILAIFTEIEKFTRALVPELAFDIEWSGVGEPVNKVVVDENGNETQQPVGQGEFPTDEGIVVVDEASNLVEVRPLPVDNAPEAPTGDTSGNTTSISGATQVVTDQSGNGMPASGMTTSGGTDTEMVDENFKPYPWDTCIADQKAKGISDTGAAKICGYIKAKYSQDEIMAAAEKDLSAEDLACIKKQQYATSGSTSGGTTQGINKTVAEVVGNKDGDYVISVCVEGGVVTEANVTSQTDLMKAANQEINDLKAQNKILMEKNAAPIGDPILTPPPVVLTPAEFSKLSAYEKLMISRGEKPVNVKK